MKQVHDIKIVSDFFDDVASGRKPFELRINDRDYKVGDVLHMSEVQSAIDCKFTGREIFAEITYIITGWGLLPEHAALGIKILWSGFSQPMGSMSAEMAKAIHAFYKAMVKEG